MFYKLDENKNVVKYSLEEWSTFIESKISPNQRHVADEVINGKRISTVFIGLCHNYSPFDNETPIVFETMIFEDGESLDYEDRYTTWQEAEEGHKHAVQWVKDGCKEED